MSKSVLVAYSDSQSSRAAVEFLCELPIDRDKLKITLLHVFRKPKAGEELMGPKFMREQPVRLMNALNEAKSYLAENGFSSDRIEIKMLKDTHETVSDGIIDQVNRIGYDIVVIGRKRLSKAEEFVLGDPSVKLVRALENTAVLVVKSS